MEEEVSFLRRKVNRLEDMIYNINDKLGLILEKFLNHRASHVAGIRDVLQVEEDICLSLVTQLKSCIINSSSSSGNTSFGGGGSAVNRVNANNKTNTTTTGRPGPKSAKAAVSLSAKSGTPTQTRQLRQQPVVQIRALRSSPAVASGRSNRNQTDSHSEQNSSTGFSIDDFDEGQGTEMDSIGTFGAHVKVEPIDAAIHDIEEIETGLPTSGRSGSGEPQDQDDQSSSSSDSEESQDSDEEPVPFKKNADEDPDYQYPRRRPYRNRPTPLSERKRPPKTYTKFRTFPSEEDARDQLKMENKYEKDTWKFTSKGKKLYYICRADHKCPVTMHVIIDEVTGAANEFICTDPSEHKHRPKIRAPNPRGLDEGVKQIVDEIFEDGMTFDQIYEELTQRGIGNIPKHKLKNYMTNLKKRKYGDLSFMKTSRSEPAPGEKRKKKKKFRKEAAFERAQALMSGSVPSTPTVAQATQGQCPSSSLVFQTLE